MLQSEGCTNLNVDNRNKDEDAGDEVTKPSEFGVFFQV
jgi:hypothetical protein